MSGLSAEQLTRLYDKMGKPPLKKFAEEVGISYDMARYYSRKFEWQTASDKLNITKLQHDVCRILIENFQKDVKDGKIQFSNADMEKFKAITQMYESAYRSLNNASKK